MSDGYRIFERNSDFVDEEEMTETDDEIMGKLRAYAEKYGMPIDEPMDVEWFLKMVDKAEMKGRADAIADVKSWFDAEFKKQNDPNSKFVPSCVIKENIYDVLEQIKEHRDV